jgi:hypothetical protein
MSGSGTRKRGRKHGMAQHAGTEGSYSDEWPVVVGMPGGDGLPNGEKEVLTNSTNASRLETRKVSNGCLR